MAGHDTPEVLQEGFAYTDLDDAEGGDRPYSADRAIEAAQNREKFENHVRAGTARAEMLKRTDISTLGFGVSNLMLTQILTGRLKPKSAKEAIEVARIAHDIARKETGEADSTIVVRGPEERAAALSRLAEMGAMVRARQLEAGPLIVDDDIDDAELVDDVPSIDVLLGSIPRSSTPLVAVRTMRADR